MVAKSIANILFYTQADRLKGGIWKKYTMSLTLTYRRIVMINYYIKTGVNVKDTFLVSMRFAFVTSIRQMEAQRMRSVLLAHGTNGPRM